MSEDHSRFPVRQKDDDWMKEFPLLVDPDPPPSRSMLAQRFPRQEAESRTDQLRSSAIRKPLRSDQLVSDAQVRDRRTEPLTTAIRQRSPKPAPSAAKAKPFSTLSRSSYDIPPPQSLVATLQSTIKAQRPTRGVLVIPGSRKKRPSDSDEIGSQTLLRRLIRHGVVLLAVVIVMMALLSMASLR